MEWVIGLLFVILIIVFAYAVARYQFGHKVAAKRLPIIIAVMAVSVIVAAVFLRVVPSEWRDYTWSVFLALCAVLILAFLIITLMRSRKAGEVLLEIGRPRGGLVIGLVGAGAILAAGIASTIQALSEPNADAAGQLRHITMCLFYFPFAFYIGFMWSSKWSIRERGIVFYGQFLAWEKIKTYQWDPDTPGTLVISVRRPLLTWRTVHLRIPEEKQQAASELMERFLRKENQA